MNKYGNTDQNYNLKNLRKFTLKNYKEILLSTLNM